MNTMSFVRNAVYSSMLVFGFGLSACASSSQNTPNNEEVASHEVTGIPSGSPSMHTIERAPSEYMETTAYPVEATAPQDVVVRIIATPKDVYQGMPALSPVYFEYNDAKLDDNDQQLLDQTAIWMSSNPSSILIIEGNSDEAGNAEYNYKIAERRAEVVRDYLLSKGVFEHRMRLISRGAANRVAEHEGNVRHWENRRVEFKLVDDALSARVDQ